LATSSTIACYGDENMRILLHELLGHHLHGVDDGVGAFGLDEALRLVRIDNLPAAKSEKQGDRQQAEASKRSALARRIL
jgi:hypothetical protein